MPRNCSRREAESLRESTCLIDCGEARVRELAGDTFTWRLCQIGLAKGRGLLMILCGMCKSVTFAD